jgi:uncharacterized surface protein with fasciclin (FAS1) repeats
MGKYLKYFAGLCLFLMLHTEGLGQAFMADVVSKTKVFRVQLVEGLAKKDPHLLDLVTKAGLLPMLSGEKEYTIFAPSPQALVQHNQDTPDNLKAFLSRHIVQGTLTTQDLADGADIKTISGESLRICRKKGVLLINGVRLTETDKLYANGVWHRLNGSF